MEWSTFDFREVKEEHVSTFLEAVVRVETNVETNLHAVTAGTHPRESVCDTRS